MRFSEVIYLALFDIGISILAYSIFFSTLSLSQNLFYAILILAFKNAVPAIIGLPFSLAIMQKGLRRVLTLSYFTLIPLAFSILFITSFKLSIYSALILILISETLNFLHNTFKYSITKKMEGEKGRLNAAFELSYSLLTIFSPFLGALLSSNLVITIAIMPILFILAIKSLKNINFKENLYDLKVKEISKEIISFISRTFILILLITEILIAIAEGIISLVLLPIVSSKSSNFIISYSVLLSSFGIGSFIASLLLINEKIDIKNGKVFITSYLYLTFFPLILLLLLEMSSLIIEILIFSIIMNGFFNSIVTIFFITFYQSFVLDKIYDAFAALLNSFIYLTYSAILMSGAFLIQLIGIKMLLILSFNFFLLTIPVAVRMNSNLRHKTYDIGSKFGMSSRIIN